MKKGSHHDDKTKNNISKKMIAEGTCSGKNNPFYGKRHTKKTKKMNRDYHLGLKHTIEWKKNASEKFSGKNNPNFGTSFKGEESRAWKGDEAGYFALHDWLRKNKPRVDCCEWCGDNKKLQLANVTGRYTRDFNDYQWFCVKCHSQYDLKVHNLKEMTDNIRTVGFG